MFCSLNLRTPGFLLPSQTRQVRTAKNTSQNLPYLPLRNASKRSNVVACSLPKGGVTSKKFIMHIYIILKGQFTQKGEENAAFIRFAGRNYRHKPGLHLPLLKPPPRVPLKEPPLIIFLTPLDCSPSSSSAALGLFLFSLLSFIS